MEENIYPTVTKTHYVTVCTFFCGILFIKVTDVTNSSTAIINSWGIDMLLTTICY